MVESPRMDVTKAAPDAYSHLIGLEQTIASRFDPKLYHLIKLRASQINGCAFCIAMHTDEALRDGESPERLTLLDAWEESSLYRDDERAALEWVEQITLIADSGAERSAYERLKAHFSDEEVMYLTLAATMINAWNRIAIASRIQYDPAMFQHQPIEVKVIQPA